MNIRIVSGAALLAVTLAGCCPGTLLNNSVPRTSAPAMTKPVDTDGDGVMDSADLCPNTPRGVSVDASGCPNDRDADGVVDSADKCPDTPRGASVNRDGCSAAQLAALAPPPPAPAKPAPTRAEQELATRAEIRLENVYFETGSAKLTPESSAPLDEAAAALAKFPALKIEVEGHTDARGSAASNLKLSQARAETVRQYMLDHSSLNPNQVTAKGYGEAGTTLTTDADQLKRDRRVVLRVLNPEALPKNVDLKQ